MTAARPTALIADDEPLLRRSMMRLLSQAWPGLDVVAEARNGREAVELFETHRPNVCFLDVQMPGLSGIEAARAIGGRSHLVFVTAFDQYALQAFEQGVLDYLVKPVEPARLAATVQRLKDRLGGPVPQTDALLDQLAERLASRSPRTLRWINVSVGAQVRPVPVEAVDFLQAEEKYTTVAWRDEDGRQLEGLIRTPLKELVAQLDPAQFVQVHRSAVVNLRAVSHVTRGENETGRVHLKGRGETLPVSRSHLHLFRHM
ncbi:MAG TPA: LytTR family DNA-binding domain-containing protein [Azospirillaceae bacterium]|nr:LytTR family DNA-binding domain-containing protein [Azospirillaceae bacterium]